MKRHSIVALALRGTSLGLWRRRRQRSTSAADRVLGRVVPDRRGHHGDGRQGRRCDGRIALRPLTSVAWRQTQGPALALISARTQAISFEPALAGAYGFSVDFRDPDGMPRSLSVTVNAVLPTSPVGVLVRADQAVREGGKASVRAWPTAAAGGDDHLDAGRGTRGRAGRQRSEPRAVHRAGRERRHPHRAARHPASSPAAGPTATTSACWSRTTSRRPPTRRTPARTSSATRTFRARIRTARAVPSPRPWCPARTRRTCSTSAPARTCVRCRRCPSCTRPPAAPSRRSARSWIAWWCRTTGWAKCSSSS